MDKNAIKKYAVWARREIISRVSQKALQYGITEENIIPADVATVNGVVLSNEEKKQRRALIEIINDKGFHQVMEEVAYTWFNRFIALRFMEVNGYLPSHVRVFTDDENNFKPQILAEAINLDFDELNMDKVYELKDANDNEALFKYLLIVQCNALNPIMPRMFQKISDYTELLFPDNLLREGSVVQQMIELIPEEDWKDAVQIIGWLYQYYNSEKKDEVFAALKKNVKITKENIPAATQLFTPDWIVRYMVENSLGRLWLEGHPNDELKSEWKYYLDEAEQEVDVQVKLDEIRTEYALIAPEQVKCIDPCAGSGHILAYMFDILMQIYEAYGYTAREAVESIIKNNIYGLDIDERAAQLAYFSVMMKARQYDRRFFSRKDEDGNINVPQARVYAIVDSNNIDCFALEYFVNDNLKLKNAIHSIIKEMYDAKEYGSVLKITPVDFKLLYGRFNEIKKEINIYRDTVLQTILPVVQVAEKLSMFYDIVITNPPYMGAKSMSAKMANYISNKYPTTKFDLFSVFIEKGLHMTKRNGFSCMVTMQSWMFLSSFEKMRKELLNTYALNDLLHMGNMVMGIAFGTAVSNFRKVHVPNYKAAFSYVTSKDLLNDIPIRFPSGGKRDNYVPFDIFKIIPGQPIAYWASENMLNHFRNKNSLSLLYELKQGLITADNERFLRYWSEVSFAKLVADASSIEEFTSRNGKWLPYNKGGEYRKWYGNNNLVVNWQNEGFEIRNFKDEKGKVLSRPQNIQYFGREGASWSIITNGNFSLRYTPSGFGFDARGSMMFAIKHSIKYALAFMCSKIAKSYLEFLSPTVSFEVGNVSKVPFIYAENHANTIEKIATECILLSKTDWDSFETSWDFQRHPLYDVIAKESSDYKAKNIYLSECYRLWEKKCRERFEKMKDNEEELNHIFIEIYGLQKELSPEVDNKDVTIYLADEKNDIKSLISYAVGCIFGRYSLDVSGLVYAGAEWDDSNYITFEVDKDNIIPICDDEYFEDDIVNRFVRFIEVVYGKGSLENNLQFIADALGGSGQPRDVIRKYFMNDFYADHLKTYQKRPIYWLFDSGKKNGFKALVYMHRYQPDTIARMRTDYVHEQQSRYRTAIADLEQRIASAATSERVKLNKKLKTLKDQAAEIQVYEEKIHHLADQYIAIDLDDGVKVNYAKFQDVLAKIK